MNFIKLKIEEMSSENLDAYDTYVTIIMLIHVH